MCKLKKKRKNIYGSVYRQLHTSYCKRPFNKIVLLPRYIDPVIKVLIQ